MITMLHLHTVQTSRVCWIMLFLLMIQKVFKLSVNIDLTLICTWTFDNFSIIGKLPEEFTLCSSAYYTSTIVGFYQLLTVS